MAPSTVLNIATGFSKYPAGRFVTDGPYPGETFRDAVLVPALRSGQQVIVELDGTLGYGSSFLEEAFGGLVRLREFNHEGLTKQLVLRCSDSSLVTEIWGYISKATPEHA